MVYVTPGDNFEEALEHAQNVFPQLSRVAPERIAFSVNVRVSGELRVVRIAPMAWSRVISTLSTYEIIDLSVLPHSQTSRAARSDSDIQASAAVGDDVPPPSYGGGGGLTIKTDDDDLLGADLREPKTPNSASSLSPTTPSLNRRCASALGWIGKHL